MIEIILAAAAELDDDNAIRVGRSVYTAIDIAVI